MNDASRRGTWDKDGADIMYVYIKYLNHSIISLTTQQGEVAWMYYNWEIRVATGDLNSNTHQRNSLLLLSYNAPYHTKLLLVYLRNLYI